MSEKRDKILDELRKMTPEQYEAGFKAELKRIGAEDETKCHIEMPNGEKLSVKEFLERNRKFGK